VSNPENAADLTRALMLRMSETWHQAGSLNQAMDFYLRLVSEYPDTEEAESAKLALMDIAQGFEADGCGRLAMGVLNRLTEATG
jgi:hypothetical protein